MILSILDFFHLKFFSGLKKYQNLYTFYVFQKMDLMPQFFYAMVVIGSLSMVGDGGGRGGVGRALAVVRVGAGSLIYRQIKSLHCSGYLLVHVIYYIEIMLIDI